MTVSPADLADSLAQHLHDKGFGHYAATGTYPASLDRPAITIGRLPQAITSAVAITPYLIDPDPFTVEGQPLHHVQLMFREPGPDPRPVLASERAAFALLHSTTSGHWPKGVSPLSVTLASVSPPEFENESWWRSANYAIRLNPGD